MALPSVDYRVVKNTLADAPELAQKKLMEPFFGFNNGTTDTQIFANSQFAIQGECILDTLSGPRLYVIQRTTGATWDTDERCRIVEYALRTDGGVESPIAFSPELELGHGANLAGLVNGSTVTLFTSASPASGQTGESGAGKGYTKINWKGASTTQSDVTPYRVFANAGAGARDVYRYATVSVSPRGEYVALIARNTNDTGRFLFVFNRAAVEAAGDPTLVAPISGPVVVTEGLGEYGGTLQGLAISDEPILYTVWGAPAPRSAKTLNMHMIGGGLIRQEIIDGPASSYSDAQVDYDSTLKFPASFEPEGASLYNGMLITGWVDSWRDAPVVSWNGKNYACIATSSTGVYPWDRANWLPTSRSATLGAFNPATTYSGLNYTRRSKAIHAVNVDNDGVALNTGKTDATSGARVVAAGGAPDASYTFGSTYQIAGKIEGYNQSITSFTIDSTTFRFYASSLDYSGYYATLSRVRDAGNDYAEILANGTVRASSPYIVMYGADDPTQPGEVRISSLGAGSVRLMFAGSTKLALNTADTVAYQVVRPLNDVSIDFGTLARRWLKGWFQNISLFPPASVTPANNGEMTFQLTSNTALAIKVRGSDGTVRTGTITLS